LNIYLTKNTRLPTDKSQEYRKARISLSFPNIFSVTTRARFLCTSSIRGQPIFEEIEHKNG